MMFEEPIDEERNIQKESDYDAVIRNIDSAKTIDHFQSVETMIDLFNDKWKPENRTTDILEATELRGVLKYRKWKMKIPEEY